MQQTLLALLAMMVAMLLNFNQMKATVQNEQAMLRAEMQQMALGVAQETMEIVRTRAYDDATVEVPKDSIIEDLSEFTSTPFPAGNHCEVFGGSDVCDDVDDFHEMEPATLSFAVPDGEMDFEVEIEVQYVDGTLQPTGGVKARRKEVIIYVQDKPLNGEPRLNNPIKFSEVLSR